MRKKVVEISIKDSRKVCYEHNRYGEGSDIAYRTTTKDNEEIAKTAQKGGYKIKKIAQRKAQHIRDK